MHRVLNTTGICLCHTDCCNTHISLLELSAFRCTKHSADFRLLLKHFKIFRSIWRLFISLCLYNKTPALLPRVTSRNFKGTVTALEREQMLSAAGKQPWVTGLMTGALLNNIARKPHCSPENSSGMHQQNMCSEGNTALEGRNFQPTWCQDQGNFSTGNLQGRTATFLGNGKGMKTFPCQTRECCR